MAQPYQHYRTQVELGHEELDKEEFTQEQNAPSIENLDTQEESYENDQVSSNNSAGSSMQKTLTTVPSLFSGKRRLTCPQIQSLNRFGSPYSNSETNSPLIKNENARSPGTTSTSKFSDSKAKRGKYKIYTDEEKNQILEFAQKYGVEKTLETFSDGENRVTRRKLKNWAEAQNKVKGVKGRKSSDYNRDMKLYSWYQNFEKEKGRPPTRKETSKKALEFNSDTDFKASKGWLDKFSRKYSLEFTPLKVFQNKKKGSRVGSEKFDSSITESMDDVSSCYSGADSIERKSIPSRKGSGDPEGLDFVKSYSGTDQIIERPYSYKKELPKNRSQTFGSCNSLNDDQDQPSDAEIMKSILCGMQSEQQPQSYNNLQNSNSEQKDQGGFSNGNYQYNQITNTHNQQQQYQTGNNNFNNGANNMVGGFNGGKDNYNGYINNSHQNGNSDSYNDFLNSQQNQNGNQQFQDFINYQNNQNFQGNGFQNQNSFNQNQQYNNANNNNHNNPTTTSTNNNNNNFNQNQYNYQHQYSGGSQNSNNQQQYYQGNENGITDLKEAFQGFDINDHNDVQNGNTQYQYQQQNHQYSNNQQYNSYQNGHNSGSYQNGYSPTKGEQYGDFSSIPLDFSNQFIGNGNNEISPMNFYNKTPHPQINNDTTWNQQFHNN